MFEEVGQMNEFGYKSNVLARVDGYRDLFRFYPNMIFSSSTKKSAKICEICGRYFWVFVLPADFADFRR